MRAVEIARLGREHGQADYCPGANPTVYAADRLNDLVRRWDGDPQRSRLYVWSYRQSWAVAAAAQLVEREE